MAVGWSPAGGKGWWSLKGEFGYWMICMRLPEKARQRWNYNANACACCWVAGEVSGSLLWQDRAAMGGGIVMLPAWFLRNQ